MFPRNRKFWEKRFLFYLFFRKTNNDRFKNFGHYFDRFLKNGHFGVKNDRF